MGGLLSRPAQWQYLEGSCHDVLHTWQRSCIVANLELSCMITYQGFKIYLPLYLISELLRSWSLLRLLKVLPHVLRSSLFLGSNLLFSLMFICIFRRLVGRFYYYQTILLPAIVGTGCAVMIERPSRRPLLAGYTATIGIDLLYMVLKQKKVAFSLPYGEVLIFCLAMAVMFHRFRINPRAQGLINSVLSGLMFPRLPPVVTSYFQSTRWNNRITQSVLVGVWAFLVGYLIQILLSVVNQRTQLKDKDKLKKALTKGFRFAAFLSSLTAGYKLASNILYHLGLPRDIRLLLAGLVAGLSMMLYRSSSLSLYVAWKALEVLYSQGVDKGWLKYIPYGDVLIYALSAAWLLHGWFFEAHNMRWSYWRFLNHITWGRLQKSNYVELDKFGTGSSKRINEWRGRNREQTK